MQQNYSQKIKDEKIIKIKLNLVCWEYSIERFSEVLNVHHRFSIFLLIIVFHEGKYINEKKDRVTVMHIENFTKPHY